MRRAAAWALFPLALSVGTLGAACASGDRVPREGQEEDSGRGGGRDAGTSTRDTGTSTRDVGGGDTGAPVRDVGGGGDAAPDGGSDATGDGGTGSWQDPWDIAPALNPLIGLTSEASHQAMVVFCSTCPAEFAGDSALCMERAFGGGFRVDSCIAARLDALGEAANEWLDCARSYWIELGQCVLDPERSCALCENALRIASLTCDGNGESVVAAMALCDG